jgi:DNA ligase-1
MFKPMLAPGEDPMSYPDYFEKLKYPLFCSPKYDGIRCITKYGKTLSRSGKILPSKQVQRDYSKLNNLDGELIEGLSTDVDVYNRTQSYVMSENKSGNISYHIFDIVSDEDLNKPFYERLQIASKRVLELGRADVKLIPHLYVENYDDLMAYEKLCLDDGYEGIMMRHPEGHYKQGRGTFKEGLIYKLKRFNDGEGILVDILPMMENHNTLEKDELGYAKRSSSKDGLVASDIAGKLVVLVEFQDEDLYLDVAPGSFTHEDRRKLLKNREEYLGKILKFRFFKHGAKDKPRFPRALGFRNKIDL